MSEPHPYRKQPPRAFWTRSVSDRHPLDIDEWYERRFQIGNQPVATAGSCFAQHIGRQLREKGFRFVDAEPAPESLAPESRLEFGYDMYSARYGNVYTSRQLLQLMLRAIGKFTPAEDYWPRGDGVVDPFRPTIEPEPFGSVDEMRASRKLHLEAVRQVFEQCRVFVFTMGLTECWISKADGAAFPVAPGTAGGEFSPARHELSNLAYPEVMQDMRAFFNRLRAMNPKVRVLLTVSPVPLMATATTDHVVVATTYSKSVLRAVAGALREADPFVDYFPSYEIINSPAMRAQFFESDMRTVSIHGVNHVMRQFFAQHRPPKQAEKPAKGRGRGIRLDRPMRPAAQRPRVPLGRLGAI